MEKYRATIRGNTVEWDGDAPPEVNEGKSVTVVITIRETPVAQSEEDRRRGVAALREIAARGGIKAIPDPVKWQREIRKDRRLPGR